ncbi:MAG: TIGR00341 family protein [Candidatus Aphodosoma sp.]
METNESQTNGITATTPENRKNYKDQQHRTHFKKDARIFFREIWHYIKDLLNIYEESDPTTTIANITKGVEFRGDNIWLLLFAMIIASVGLNVNSTAVIIGAMLVSPLMGPIMGVGLAIGINDNGLLRKSLKNLLTMIVIALIASSFYFLITPLSDAQSELLARTKPTIFDVFIAFFGGAAGILASSRKQEKITVVSGVAIATALMPPLCTAGYGIGTGQLIYFFGAFYLFFINSVFIALATFIMVRYLHFPKCKYMDAARERRVRRSIMIFAIIVLVPSIFTAWNVIRESSFDNTALHYIENIKTNPVMSKVQIISSERSYSRKGSEIRLSLVGEALTGEQISVLQQRMAEMGLKDTKLKINQTSGASLDIKTQARMLQDFIEDKDRIIASKDSLVRILEQQIAAERNRANVTAGQLAAEITALYPSIEQVTMANAIKVDARTSKTDTIPTISVKWAEVPTDKQDQQLTNWLRVRFNNKKIEVTNL